MLPLRATNLLMTSPATVPRTIRLCQCGHCSNCMTSATSPNRQSPRMSSKKSRKCSVVTAERPPAAPFRANLRFRHNWSRSNWNFTCGRALSTPAVEKRIFDCDTNISALATLRHHPERASGSFVSKLLLAGHTWHWPPTKCATLHVGTIGTIRPTSTSGPTLLQSHNATTSWAKAPTTSNLSHMSMPPQEQLRSVSEWPLEQWHKLHDKPRL